MIVKQAPDGSAIHRTDPAWRHTIDLELARASEFWLRWLHWAKTADGAKNRNRPEPLRFPWEPEPENPYRGDALPMDEMAARLGWA